MRLGGLRCGGTIYNFLPIAESWLHQVSIILGPREVPAGGEERSNYAEDGEELLSMLDRLDSTHSALPFSRRLVGVFCAIVESLVLPMFDARHHFFFGRAAAQTLL